MNATTLMITATLEQKALYNKGMNDLRKQFESMTDAELGCNGCCNTCQWEKLCEK